MQKKAIVTLFDQLVPLKNGDLALIKALKSVPLKHIWPHSSLGTQHGAIHTLYTYNTYTYAYNMPVQYTERYEA